MKNVTYKKVEEGNLMTTKESENLIQIKLTTKEQFTKLFEYILWEYFDHATPPKREDYVYKEIEK